MRPIRLELRGFTAFREKTVVDFEGRRLFAITGPTGAGKSSLLDAMTWALFGQVPRVGSSTRQLVSHGATSMQVRFDFATRDQIYRVVRKAPAVTGTRLEQQQADGSWRHLADRSRDVTREVTRLLGMDFTTFTRTVLLPQGEFDAFLKGEQSERRAILTKLLGLGIYDDARKIANDRAKRARERSSTIEAQLAQLNLASPERIAELEQEQAAAEKTLAALSTRKEQLRVLGELTRAARDAAKAQTDAQAAAELATKAQTDAETALKTATATVTSAEHRCDDLSRERTALAYDPAQHQALRGQVDQLKRREAAERELTEAKRKLEEARGAHTAAIGAAASAAGALAETESKLSAATEVLTQATAVLSEATGRARLALAGLESRAVAAKAELDQTVCQRDALGEQLPQLQTAAQRLAERTAARESAAAEATRTAEERARAEQAAAAAAEELAGATKQLESARARLTEARHIDLAATLRAELKPGDMCPVCGDPIKQLPMEFGAEGLSAAQSAVQEAERLIEEHRRSSSEARSLVAAATARAESATTALTSAHALLEAIDEELATLETSRDSLPSTLEERRKAFATAQARAVTAEQTASKLIASHGELKLALAGVPADVPAAEVADACEEPSALRDALDVWQLARAAVVAAERELQRARAAHGDFEKNIAANGARVEAAEDSVKQAEQRLAEHGDAPAGIDAEALRKELAAAEQTAKRAEELDGLISTAKATIAGSIATRAAAESEQARMVQAVTQAKAELDATSVAATTERAALEAAWREAIGAEPEPSVNALRELMNAHQEQEREAFARGGALKAQIDEAKKQAENAERMHAEVASDRAIAELNGALARELQGDRFVGYVQREAMQLLAADASYRLDGFTGGRYELASEDNEFVVVDRLNGDERRSVKTLSGGETFLASLALALSLSEHLPQLAGLGGAVSLESLFLDEGFGALDSESLDLAVQGLETIASGQRMIGVISHVEEMAERMPERIEVVKQGNSSIVRG